MTKCGETNIFQGFFEKNDDEIEDPTDGKDDEEKEYKTFEDLFKEEEI